MVTTKVKIQFHDCDPAGILFFANIYKLAHNAYQEFLEQGLTWNYFEDGNVALPIIKSTAEYHKPMKSGEVFTVKLLVSNLKDSSFELTYLFYDNASDLYAEVKTVHVSVNKITFEKIKLSADLSQLLTANYV
jgi:1,4-dihydroxy-2-naphthoyl-CoA hydrolase